MVITRIVLSLPLVPWAGTLAQRLNADLKQPDATMICLAAAVAILGVVVISSSIPARRAARVDPSEALRHE